MRKEKQKDKQKDKKNSINWESSGAQVRLIAACLVMSVIVFLILLGVEKNMLAQYEKRPVPAVKQEVPAGTLITEHNADTYFEIRELEQAAIPGACFQSLEELYGYMPVISLSKGTVPTASMLETQQEKLLSMQNPVLAGITAEDIYQVVGGVLRAGDTITIYSVDRESEETQLIQTDVPVIQVFDSSGGEIAKSDKITSAQRLNVYLEKETVEALYSSLAAGSLRVVKELQ